MLQVEKAGREPSRPLLSKNDPIAYEIINPGGRSRVVLMCEHAGRAVPESLGDLGLSAAEFDRHIAYDIGAEAVARRLSDLLDAPLALQPYSRLVIDCNRPFQAPDCIVQRSDTTLVPANQNLSDEQKQARFTQIHQAFHDQVTRLLDTRLDPAATILVSVHSFTPRLSSVGVDRPWELGLLFNREPRFARRLMTACVALRPEIVAAYNEPYAGSDISDYGIPIHGERRGIEHVLIEIRNNLISDETGQAQWSTLLARAIKNAISDLAS